jgi:hypothetical protein
MTLQNRDELQQLCEEGAREVAADHCDGIRFDLMPDEVEFVKVYMRQHHPNVPFLVSYPSWGRP